MGRPPKAAPKEIHRMDRKKIASKLPHVNPAKTKINLSALYKEALAKVKAPDSSYELRKLTATFAAMIPIADRKEAKWIARTIVENEDRKNLAWLEKPDAIKKILARIAEIKDAK